MVRNLTFPQLLRLLQTVFDLRESEKALTLFVDMPTVALPDSPAWKDQRRIVAEWFSMLQTNIASLPFSELNCCSYPNVGSNNNDLPPVVTLVERTTRESPGCAVQDVELETILAGSSVVMSLTQFSATAPLKVLARKLGFRGATLPGFTREMIPALLLDYERINARVLQLKERMDRAEGATVILAAGEKQYVLSVDLRFRTGHASGGLIRDQGTVANLPSGEAYIVPYEGEREGEPSKTSGLLPVQFEKEVVVFRIQGNRAVRVESSGGQSTAQQRLLDEEPAYGNVSELGIGVLSEWGVEAVGSTLLDEKLGLHIAFGRSEHFGGNTSPAAFKDPKKVAHVDWVYVPSIQSSIDVVQLVFQYAGGTTEILIESGVLTV